MKYNGYEIEIDIDESPEDPRSWDEVSTLVTAHRSYKGDEELPTDCDSIEEAFEQHLKWEGLTMEQVYYHRVYLYEHSGVSVSITPYGDRWDSGIYGYIYVSIEDAEQNFVATTKDALEKESLAYMDRQIEALNKYYGGDIYELHIPLLDEHIGGFDSEEEALKEAKAYIDNADPKGHTMKMADDLYTRTMDMFWDNVNEQTFEDCVTLDGDTDEAQRDMIVNIIGEKLKNY